jgi:AraC family transcriptional regulator of adaptative response/methylated-DNA-[protein]-cysteine methyltransferase
MAGMISSGDVEQRMIKMTSQTARSLSTARDISQGPADRFWLAIQGRDAGFDGLFYYGVRTTGVFCRPACPSRRPRRANVSYFALPEAARAAGFRACLRCRPDGANPRDPQAELVQGVCRLIESATEERPDMDAVGEQLRLSRSHLQRLFKKLMGITPREYAEALRVERFKGGVRAGRSVTDAMYEAGYGSSSRLYEKASAQLGMTPATYRKGGRGMTIRYTIAESPLGPLLVAATERGVCSVQLGDESGELARALRDEFPRADVRVDETGLRPQVRALLDYLEGQRPHPDLPLDVQGTAFQRRVWEELRRIPPGETASYGEVAVRIGRPTAARAVARACATNPAALVTPCHRVVGADGSVGGYRWGVARKRKLLERERGPSED